MAATVRYSFVSSWAVAPKRHGGEIRQTGVCWPISNSPAAWYISRLPGRIRLKDYERATTRRGLSFRMVNVPSDISLTYCSDSGSVIEQRQSTGPRPVTWSSVRLPLGIQGAASVVAAGQTASADVLKNETTFPCLDTPIRVI